MNGSSMDNLNHRVIQSASNWLEADQAVWLITILETWGSSPRPAGSMLTYNPRSGQFVGSLSGGCIEENLLTDLGSRKGGQELPSVKIYGETEDERQRFQLPCGGKLKIALEYLAPDKENQSLLQQICHRLDCQLPVMRIVDLLTGKNTLDFDEPATLFDHVDDGFKQTLHPGYKMLILGAGEVSRYAAQFALATGFEVTVCEPREHFSSSWELPGVECIPALPDDLVRERFNDRYCAVVALAHDPRVDDMGLMEALGSNAFYVGAMGSRKTSIARAGRLASLGVSDANLSRLHGPIGFDIGSKTPPEIAIAVVAEVIAVKNQSLQIQKNKQNIEPGNQPILQLMNL